MDNDNVWKGLAFGGFASCCAELVTLPIDVTKVRLQLQGELGAVRQYNGFLDCMKKTVQGEGITALWKGTAPALLRQATYGSLRYGLYTPIKDAIGIGRGVSNGDIPLYKKIVAGSLSGAVSSGICNPADLIKVRLQADGMGKGPGHIPRYRGLFHAFSDIVQKEGVLGLWKGVGPTSARATVLAAAELSSYDEIKSLLLENNLMSNGIGLHFATASAAGFISAWFSSPFDVVKSRYMNQAVDAKGKGVTYSGMFDCFGQSMKSEGVFCLWKGFWPNAGRVVPRVIIIFLIMEQLKLKFG